MRYVKIENPSRFLEEFRPSPSFSLFLAAKLAHGAIVVHHKQVTHGLGKLCSFNLAIDDDCDLIELLVCSLAHVMLEFQQKAAQKKLKATNISCDM
jgi:hypothetical protein